MPGKVHLPKKEIAAKLLPSAERRIKTRKLTEGNPQILTENELAALYALELPTNQAEVRDCFLISCYTGLRYSDISRLSMEHIRIDLI